MVVTGCKEYGPPKAASGTSSTSDVAPSGPGVPVAADAKLAGRVRMGNKQWPVRVFIGHDAKMDLRVHCLSARDAAKKEAGEGSGSSKPPLCFDPNMVKKLDRIRVEFAKGATGGQMMRTLRARNEAAHFMVERTGSLYQVLDMGLSPRRADAIQRGELRIVSASKSGQARLVESLGELLGKIPVVEANLTLAEPTPPPKAAVPTPTPDAKKTTSPTP